jgi:hypothetical protein
MGSRLFVSALVVTALSVAPAAGQGSKRTTGGESTDEVGHPSFLGGAAIRS